MKKGIFFSAFVILFFLAGCSSEPTADELFEKAKTAYNEGDFHNALSDLQQFMKKYPKDPQYPEVLFLYAFINANQTNNLDEAKKAYQEFLDKFPQNEMAASAKFELENLGKPIEQILLNIDLEKSSNDE